MAQVIIRCVLSLQSIPGWANAPFGTIDPARNPGAPEFDGRSRSSKATCTVAVSAQAGIDHALPDR